MAEATGLIFHCSTLLQPEKCLLAYRSMCNAFFMDLPVPSFVFHLSLLTVKSVDLVVACDDFLCITEIICIFDRGYFDCCFSYNFGFVLLCNGGNSADNEL